MHVWLEVQASTAPAHLALLERRTVAYAHANINARADVQLPDKHSFEHPDLIMCVQQFSALKASYFLAASSSASGHVGASQQTPEGSLPRLLVGTGRDC